MNYKVGIKATMVALMAALVTKGAIYVCNQHSTPDNGAETAYATMLTTDEEVDNNDDEKSEETDMPEILSVEDHLEDRGWLLAQGIDEETEMAFAVLPGTHAADIPDEEWERLCRPLTASDTVRPKRDCTVVIMARKNKMMERKTFSFSFCRFVENNMAVNGGNNGIMRRLFFAYDNEHPLTINYDYGNTSVEDLCRTANDQGKLDNLYLAFNDEEERNAFHVDSIRTYSSASPTEESLQKHYPSIAFINVRKATSNNENSHTPPTSNPDQEYGLKLTDL